MIIYAVPLLIILYNPVYWLSLLLGLHNDDLPGWTEQVKPELYMDKFWYWMWTEADMPQSDAAYEVMKRPKHPYHYAHRIMIRMFYYLLFLCKINEFVIQKETLARHINQSREYWIE